MTGGGNNLTITSPATTLGDAAGDSLTGLGTLQTDAAGTTTINAGAISGATLTFLDNVVLGNPVSLTHSGANSLAIAGGTLSLGSSTLTDTASTLGTTGTIGATISGTGGLTKNGPGTLTLTVDNSYQGTTSVTAGLLLVNNPGAGSGTGTGPVDVSGTGTLGGTGNVGGSLTATGSGTVAPGSPISGTTVLDTGAVSFTAGTTFQAQVNGNTPGTGHDQLNVTGSVTLNGATLSLSGTIPSSPSQVVVLISNDGSEPVSGTFAWPSGRLDGDRGHRSTS